MLFKILLPGYKSKASPNFAQDRNRKSDGPWCSSVVPKSNSALGKETFFNSDTLPASHLRGIQDDANGSPTNTTRYSNAASSTAGRCKDDGPLQTPQTNKRHHHSVGRLKGLFWYPRLPWVPLLTCGTQPNQGYQNRPLREEKAGLVKTYFQLSHSGATATRGQRQREQPYSAVHGWLKDTE
ncbi:hypothetical protein AVEN_36011-1 [Araneus ventricosus]|uniref:Uncharacterized protein n=1 Tax=Araneus ventricosus TaxID=182803 RepID=A0A4Y2KHB4_ARAVE|nr:hypothetical protein AVEN_36011-1 [Araneus ventricosus]